MNSISGELAVKIDFMSSTAYEVFKLVTTLNQRTKSERIEDLKDELIKMKYDPKNNETLSIFISDMNLKFKELKELNVDLDYQEKFKHLYSALPEDLAIKSNILRCDPDWKQMTEYLIKVNQQLKGIQEIINKKEEKTSTSLSAESKINSDYNNSNYNSHKTRNNNHNNHNQNQKRNNYNNNKTRNNNYSNNNKFNKNNIKCWNCGKFGHFSDECRVNDSYYKNNKVYKSKPKNKNYNKGRPQIKKIHCKNAEIDNNNNKNKNKHEEYFFEDYNDSNNAESNNVYFNYSNNMLPTQKVKYYTCNELMEEKKANNGKDNNKNKLNAWTLDSGTTYHMTGDLDCLSDLNKFNKRIYFANGESVKSKYIGTYKGYINDNKINLKNVLYVPVFKKNLISIDCLSDQYYKTIFQKLNNKNNVSIYNKKNNKVCSTSANSSKTYIIWTSKNKIEFENNLICNNTTNAREEDNLHTWHRRLGHYNIQSLRIILTKINTKCICKVCAKSKLKNFPFHENKIRASEPFEKVHIDTVSLKQPSLYGNTCFITILDDYSRYGWVVFCKSKKEIFNVFKIWYNKIKNIFNKNIKYLHSDNGTEFINNKFNEFCNINGIVFEHTIPNNPQQNGRVERLHGTLFPSARAMLEEAHLNHVFWEDAIKTANFIHNRIP